MTDQPCRLLVFDGKGKLGAGWYPGSCLLVPLPLEQESDGQRNDVYLTPRATDELSRSENACCRVKHGTNQIVRQIVELYPRSSATFVGSS